MAGIRRDHIQAAPAHLAGAAARPARRGRVSPARRPGAAGWPTRRPGRPRGRRTRRPPGPRPCGSGPGIRVLRPAGAG
ncbi:hypothetical protein DMB42_38590 [Nonomuraea sp. WAC 01424]|nr:hypothetical protein DMB42_38590 [Nonomuraea sp. WAC 01424]